METISWWLSAILNTQRSKKDPRITPRRLFRRPDAAPEFATAAEFTEYMKARNDV